MMKINIETLSYTLIGSGEGSGLINVDLIFDELGIPYIPSRRIKGILRNKALELTEILGISHTIVDNIFGKSGFKESKLRIGNLYIKNYKDIKNELKALMENNNLKGLITKNKIINFFTILRKQTAIDENGVAKEHSLRTIRVLKPYIEFIGEIVEFNHLTEKEKALLYLTVLIFKRIGTARNRGFGGIKCSIDGLSIGDSEKAIKLLKKETDMPFKVINETSSFNYELNYSNKTKKLPFLIETLCPILIVKHNLEQNVVNTEKYIPATTIRGVLASKFIEKRHLKENIHENKDFYDLFLKGQIIYTPAYPIDEQNNKVHYFTPFFIHVEKENKETNILNILENELDIKTRYLGGFLKFENDRNVSHLKLKTEFYFHNTRNRFSGKSEEGEIFYYEAISEGQGFKGYIIGDEEILKSLIKILGESFHAFLGRSKTAQYGNVKITLIDVEKIEPIDFEGETEFIFWLLSPLILYNEYGTAEASTKTLKKYFCEILKCKIDDFQIEGIVAKTEFVENFISVWRMRTPREVALAPGSSFKVRLKDCDNLNKKLEKLEVYGIGERREEGFGRIKILISSLNYKIIKTQKTNKITKPKKSIKILFHLLENDLERFFNYKGFMKAKDFKYINRLTKNLIGKMERMINNSEDNESWRAKFDNLKNKQAEEKLKNARLWDELEEFNIYYNIKKNTDFQRINYQINKLQFNINDLFIFKLSKMYWLSFFKNLRFLKKKED